MISPNNTLQRIVVLGAYDKGKPRTRILLRGLKENSIEVIECHFDIWGDIEDKSQVSGLWSKLSIIWKIITAYPVLIWRYFQIPKHDVVLIGYLGLFDVLFLWPFVRIRRSVLVWDVFLSLYNTVVEDRKMIGQYNPAAIALWIMEWLALRMVDLALMDTQAHADYLRTTYNCTPDKITSVLVGVEPEKFDLNAMGLEVINQNIKPKQILFYGQFIPLHGIETVIQAAKLTENDDIEWLIIGKGQESAKIQTLIDKLNPTNLRCIEWVNYNDLIKYLANCHIALGIFGTTDKAKRVIPNKVFQILMAGRPLITGDTAAIRELLQNDGNIHLIPLASPNALVEAVRTFPRSNSLDTLDSQLSRIRSQIVPAAIGLQLIENINSVLLKR